MVAAVVVVAAAAAARACVVTFALLVMTRESETRKFKQTIFGVNAAALILFIATTDLVAWVDQNPKLRNLIS